MHSNNQLAGAFGVGLVLVAAAAGGCRPKTEVAEEQRRPEEVARVQPPATPTPAPAVQDEPAAEEPVGTAETHGATTPSEGANMPSAPTSLPPFEGELRVDVRDKAPESVEYAMKGDKIRIGLSSTPGRNDKGVDAIIDTSDQKATILLNERKEFIEVDLAAVAAKAKQRIESIGVERTGEISTVAGRECEEWKIKDRDYQVSACVMKGAPYFDLAELERRANFKAPQWVHRIVDAGYVPLKVSFADASGKTLGTSQIADTSRQVEKSKFEIPTGYRKADVSKSAPKAGATK
jgi:hypothetical protein